MASTAPILATSDDPNVRRALAAGLAGRDARVARLPAGAKLQRHLRAGVPPVLLVADLDAAPDPGAEVRTLLGCLAPGTALLAVVTDTGPRLAVELIRSGAADVLVKPLGAGIVRSAVAASLDAGLASRDAPARAGRVVCVSGTPGSGVRTVVAALCASALETVSAVVLLGCDPLGPAFAGRLGPHRVVSWLDPLSSPSDGVSLLERPLGASCSRSDLEPLVMRCANAAPALVVAAGGATEPSLRLDAFGFSDVSVLLVEPSIESAASAAQHLGCLGPHVPVLCVVSAARAVRGVFSDAQLRYALGDRDLVASLPYDAAVARSPESGPAPGRRWRAALATVADLAGLGGL